MSETERKALNMTNDWDNSVSEVKFKSASALVC